jgi:hypothetical protein
MEREYHLPLGEGFVYDTDEIFAAWGVNEEAFSGTPASENLGDGDEVPFSAGATGGVDAEAVPGALDSETLAGTDEASAAETDGTEEAGGGSTPRVESSDFDGASSGPEVSNFKMHPWWDDEYWADDTKDANASLWDGWTLVEKGGCRTASRGGDNVSHKTQPENPVFFTRR